jgi:transcriptional regulator with AAA-type ATPase domain
MALFEPDEWSFAEQAADLVATNPFQPGWRAKECALLGRSARDAEEDYSWRPGWGLWGPGAIHPDVDQLGERISDLAEDVWRRLQNRARATERELSLYETLALFRLYRDHGEGMDCFIDSAVRGGLHQPGQSDPQGGQGPPGDVKSMWKGFLPEYSRLFHLGYRFPLHFQPEHVFACFFLFRRAVYHIFYHIVGTSKPIARLRAAVWESIVTHDFRDWSRSLYRRMRDFPTLITGPSGTGKELVAQAIGRSLYIPFDPAKKAFAFDFLKAFNPVNLSALPPLLIESELFGHVKGAFSGAIDHRVGRLEQCPENGAVFLDEVGELTPEIQVKLLRVLQERRFQRVGANEDREFFGKIIAATNRDLAAEMQARRFREDLYYRLCADLIATPSLYEQLTDRPGDLDLLVEFACRRVVGEDSAAEFSREVVKWIRQSLRGHTWPGNFRELEQCVRSYTIRKEYHPARLARTRAGEGSSQPPCDPVAGACEVLAGAVLEEKTTFEKIKRRLFTLVLAGTPTAKEAARRLGLDYRTVQAWVKGTDDRSADG